MTNFTTDELKHVSEVTNIPMAHGDNPNLRFTPMGRSLEDLTDAEVVASYLRRQGAVDSFDLGGALGVVDLTRAEGAFGSLAALCVALLAGRGDVSDHYQAVGWLEENSEHLRTDYRITADGTAFIPVGAPPLVTDVDGLLPAGIAGFEYDVTLPIWPSAGCHIVGNPNRGVCLYRAKETDGFSFTPCPQDPSADFWEPCARPYFVQCRPGFGWFELKRTPALDAIIEKQEIYAMISGSKAIFPVKVPTTGNKIQGRWPKVADEVVISLSSNGSVVHKALVEKVGRGFWETRHLKILTGVQQGHLWILSA